MKQTTINKLNKKEIDDEFFRMINTYDYNTLIKLFEDRFDTATKREWIKEFHRGC